MKKVIHHLRRQPEDVRRHILHILTAFFAVILVSLWVYTLGTNLASSQEEEKENSGTEPLSVLKDNFIGGYKSIYGDNTLE